jgi:nucleotide-binding universal stress UspA family protein
MTGAARGPATDTLEAGRAIAMPSTLIVPLDGSRRSARALGVARCLAAPLHASIVLVFARWGADEPDVVDAIRGAATERPDIVTETRFVVNRTPIDAISGIASEYDRSMICMATHGQGRLRWAVVGSVAEDVLHRATRPTLLVGKHCASTWPRSFEHLMLCVDGTAANDATVPVAIAWAKSLGLDVTVTEAIHPLDVETAEHGDPSLRAIVDRIEAVGVPAREAIVRGSSFIAGSLADHATDISATLIVMSSHSRSGLARLTLGSTAIGTVALAPCPVLMVPRSHPSP